MIAGDGIGHQRGIPGRERLGLFLVAALNHLLDGRVDVLVSRVDVVRRRPDGPRRGD